jgi:hypothetical protein
MNFTYVAHDMTADFIAKLKTETQDLVNLFKILTPEELSLLASSSDVDRIKIIDRLYAKSDAPAAAQTTESPAVLTPGATLVSPSQPAQAQTAPIAPLAPTPAPSASVGPFGSQQAPVAASAVTQAPLAPTPAASIQPQAQSAQAPKEAKSLSDADFMKMFTPR